MFPVPRRKTNQTIKKRFLINNYTGQVIFNEERYRKRAEYGFFSKLRNVSKALSLTFFSMTPSQDENLFRLIFETKIHTQTHIRHFRSFPITTYD